VVAEAAPPATPPPNVVVDDSPAALPPLPALTAPLAPIASTPLPALEPAHVSDCPTAAISDFPKEAATRNVAVDRRPAAGTYRWKRTGAVSGVENREIRNVTEEAPATDAVTGDPIAQFTFDTVQTDIRTGAIVTRTWHVKTGGESTGAGD